MDIDLTPVARPAQTRATGPRKVNKYTEMGLPEKLIALLEANPNGALSFRVPTNTGQSEAAVALAEKATRTVAAAKNAITAACREHSTPFTVRYASEVVESDDSLDAEIVVSFWAHAEDGKPALITRRRVPAGE